jgi:F-type H+-transporting ATPase subunit delta
MRAAAVARRYARALFELAEERGHVDAVASALATTCTLLQDEDIARVLRGPAGRQVKQRVLTDVALGIAAPAEFRDFVLLLADHDRIRQLAAIREVFDALLDRRRGITRARVRSAAPLPESMLDEITRVFERITAKRVIATTEIDPELIAGVVVEVDGRVYDGSVRTQLEKLHRQMASGD